MIRGSLSHLDLTVADLSQSVPYYDKVLGRLGFLRYRGDGSGTPCWKIEDNERGAFSIALQPASSESANRNHDRYCPGLHHFAFHADSREDVDGFHEFLLEIGATVLDPPAEYGYTPGYYAVFFSDPDGLKLELVFEPELRGRVAGS